MRRSSDALVLALHRWLLALAPRAFRARFGAELLDCAARALADAGRERGVLASLSCGLRSAADVGASALILHCESPAMKKTLCLLPVVLLAALGTGWIDAHQDEVQPAVLLLVLGGVLFAYLDARRAWLWWLVLGASIPAARLWLNLHGQALDEGPFIGTCLAFLPAGVGALLGFGLRAARDGRPRPGAPA